VQKLPTNDRHDFELDNIQSLPIRQGRENNLELVVPEALEARQGFEGNQTFVLDHRADDENSVLA